MSRTIHRTSVLAVVTVLTAGAAAAQTGPHHRMMDGAPGQGGPLAMMPALGAFQPRALLDRETELGLTAAQVDSLVVVAEELERVVAEARQTHQDYQQDLRREAALAQPDEPRLRAAFLGAHSAMGNWHWAEVHASLAARALLTPDQRTRAGTTP